MNNKVLTVLIVDDHPVLRAGLRISLEQLPRVKVIGEASDGLSATRETLRLHPDVVLMDVSMPGMDGIEAVWHIKRDSPRTRILMFTSIDSAEDVTSALGAGADGYCLKHASTTAIESAIDALSRGEVWIDPEIARNFGMLQAELHSNSDALSKTELRVIELIGQGMDNVSIAQRMQLDVQAVAGIMRHIIRRRGQSKDEDFNSNNKFSNEWFSATVDTSGGTILANKYLLDMVLGSGGIGVVVKARHLYMDRTVALKFLKPEFREDARVTRTFQQEAKALAALKHKNIVDVYDFGVTECHQPFLVMEFVEGTDFKRILDRAVNQKLPYPIFLNVFSQVAAALASAHDHDIVHCDLKPSNILVQNENYEIKLVDFGLAKSIPRNPTVQSQATDSFTIDGTPAYMPPEQCAGTNIDKQTDIYALGCVMYEALAGITPFGGESPMQIIAKQFEFTPPPVSVFCPEMTVDPELEQCIAKMLAKNPKKRQECVREILDLLERLSCTV